MENCTQNSPAPYTKPSFCLTVSINPFRWAQSCFLRSLVWSDDFKSIFVTRSLSRLPQNSVVNFPGSIFNEFKTFKTQLEPSLKLSTTDATPISKVARPTNTSLGHFYQMTLLRDSLLFWVFPCRHFFQ